MKTLKKIAVIGIAASSLLAFGFSSSALAAPTKAATTSSASTTLKGSLPNGKPFQYLNSRIDALQAQIDLLIGRVTSLEDWQVKAQLALDKLELNVAKNAAAIALLEGQIADIKAILDTKQDIINGECPQNQYLYKVSPTDGLVCRADVGANGLTVLTVEQVGKVDPAATAEVTAKCTAGSATGGSFNAAPGLIVNSSGITPDGYKVSATNPTLLPLDVIVTATCVAVNP